MTDDTSKKLKGLRHIIPSEELLHGVKQAKLREFIGLDKAGDPGASSGQRRASDLAKDDLIGVEGLPTIMRFPPNAYRKVEPARLDEWKKEVEGRLGERLDLSSDFGATESFTRSADDKTSFKSDYDADGTTRSGSAMVSDQKGHLRPWPAAPVILGFPPVAFERVKKPSLPAWRKLLEDKLGISGIDLMDAAGMETTSWCDEYPFGPGGPHVLYACDCDMDGGSNPVAGRR